MKKVTTNIFKVAILALFVTVAISCDDDNALSDEKDTYRENINNVVNNVIFITYEDLSNKGKLLYEAAIKFKENQTASNLDAVKQAWRSARAPWEKSEGFLYGPVSEDQLNIDGQIDSWPVNVVDMNALLEDTKTVPNITEIIINKQSDEAKGFHLIEYLLWGLEGNKQVDDFTLRQIEYLVAACENLRNKTSQLYNAWRPDKGNYIDNFLNPSNGKKIISRKNAILDIITGIIGIADEVGNAKIEDPFNGNSGEGDVTKEESRFSNNSKLDFANNIRSIQNIYNGKYGNKGDGKGIKQVVAAFDSVLAKKIETEITAAISTIESISGTFTDAITSDRTGVEKAQKAVQALQTSLEEAKKIVSKKM